MKKTSSKIKDVVDRIVDDYGNALVVDGKVLGDLTKASAIVQSLTVSEVDSLIKRKDFKLRAEKNQLEIKRFELDSRKLDLDQDKLKLDQDKAVFEQKLNETKLRLEFDRLEFDKEKLLVEKKQKLTTDRLSTIKTIAEVGLPLIVYLGLAVLSLKASYADDIRVPSETWKFINSVTKR